MFSMRTLRINQQELVCGLLMIVGFTVYYEVMKLAGLYTNSYLRLFNFVIEFGLIYWLMKRLSKNESVMASTLMLSGVRASFIGVFGFSVIMFVYLLIDRPFLNALQSSSALGEYLTPLSGSILVFTEGMIAGGFASFLSARLLKSEKVLVQDE